MAAHRRSRQKSRRGARDFLAGDPRRLRAQDARRYGSRVGRGLHARVRQPQMRLDGRRGARDAREGASRLFGRLGRRRRADARRLERLARGGVPLRRAARAGDGSKTPAAGREPRFGRVHAGLRHDGHRRRRRRARRQPVPGPRRGHGRLLLGLAGGRERARRYHSLDGGHARGERGLGRGLRRFGEVPAGQERCDEARYRDRGDARDFSCSWTANGRRLRLRRGRRFQANFVGGR
mmetsp:Transcript_190/g.573  ORF Transcript_190/g.573 Transcript_190/m.573 type:complete len:236 (+) Transcript_190:691-1398(+)